jgi:hypothetical protein
LGGFLSFFAFFSTLNSVLFPLAVASFLNQTMTSNTPKIFLKGFCIPFYQVCFPSFFLFL